MDTGRHGGDAGRSAREKTPPEQGVAYRTNLIHGNQWKIEKMDPKVLIIEEPCKGNPANFGAFVICCMRFDYQYRICHDLEELPHVLEAFKPDIVFWVMSCIDRRNALYLELIRSEYENIKVVSTTHIQDYGYNAVDMHFFHPILSFEEFQEVMTKFFG